MASGASSWGIPVIIYPFRCNFSSSVLCPLNLPSTLSHLFRPPLAFRSPVSFRSPIPFRSFVRFRSDSLQPRPPSSARPVRSRPSRRSPWSSTGTHFANLALEVLDFASGSSIVRVRSSEMPGKTSIRTEVLVQTATAPSDAAPRNFVKGKKGFSSDKLRSETHGLAATFPACA